MISLFCTQTSPLTYTVHPWSVDCEYAMKLSKRRTSNYLYIRDKTVNCVVPGRRRGGRWRCWCPGCWAGRSTASSRPRRSRTAAGECPAAAAASPRRRARHHHSTGQKQTVAIRPLIVRIFASIRKGIFTHNVFVCGFLSSLLSCSWKC